MRENQLEFVLQTPLVLEEDFLLRIRHFMSQDYRYSIGRIMISPLMIFQSPTKISGKFFDFGECVAQNEEEFFLEFEVEILKARLSKSY